MKEERLVSKTGGAKGSKQARFDLLDWNFLWEFSRLMGRGAEKYDEHNWRKGYNWSLSVAAMFRHIAQFIMGETHDAETGRHHMASVAFHAQALYTFSMDETYSEFNDLVCKEHEDVAPEESKQQARGDDVREIINKGASAAVDPSELDESLNGDFESYLSGLSEQNYYGGFSGGSEGATEDKGQATPET